MTCDTAEKDSILAEIEQLKQKRPAGWKGRVTGLCRTLYRLENPAGAYLIWRHEHPEPTYPDAYRRRLGRCPWYDQMEDSSMP
jgi:hypothetical protein